MALQKHWLYHFEQKELVDFCNERGFNVALKSVDDKDPLPPQCRPRGRGGVAIIWKKDIDSMVSLVSDGGDRIQALNFVSHTVYVWEITTQQVILFNMPVAILVYRDVKPQ